MLWVGLNPSTADSDTDDPTIRRMIGFAEREGFGGIEVVNLLSQRTKDPKELEPIPEPGLARAERRDAILRCRRVVVAWGALNVGQEVGALCDRQAFRVRRDARAAGQTLWCLGRTKAGEPRHPLYLKSDTPMEVWKP